MTLSRPVLLRVLALAFGLRLLWVLLCPVVPVDDAFAYDAFAQNLANGDGYGWRPGDPSLFWAPGTSFLLAAFYWVFGHHYGPVVVFQVLLGTFSVYLVMALASQLYDEAVALYAGLLLACWPAQIQFTSLLQSELLFEVLFLLAFLAYLRLSRPAPQILVTGLLLALASYVRPLAMLAPFLFVFLVQGPKFDWRGGALRLVGLLLVLYAGLVPWALRNQQVSGHWVWVSANSGANLWMGNNPQTTGEYMHLPPEVYGLAEVERDQRLGQMAKSYIVGEPIAFLGRTLKKLVKLHDRETIGVVWNAEGLKARLGEGSLGPLKVVSTAYWWGALALGLIGVLLRLRALRLRVVFEAPLLFWAYFAAVHAVVVVMDRYHFPSVPFIAILAAQAGVWLRGRRRAEPPPVLG